MGGMMEVHCTRCWARAIVTGSGDPFDAAKWSLRVRSDFEKECVVRHEHPETTLEEFDCEHLLAAIRAALQRSRQAS